MKKVIAIAGFILVLVVPVMAESRGCMKPVSKSGACQQKNMPSSTVSTIPAYPAYISSSNSLVEDRNYTPDEPASKDRMHTP